MTDLRANQILIIDDDESIRNLLEAVFESNEGAPLIASTAEQALALLRDNLDEAKICLLDMNLDETSGEIVFDQLVELKPDLAIFPMSGSYSEEVKTRLGDRNYTGLINKPFVVSQLLKTIKDGMDARAKRQSALRDCI